MPMADMMGDMGGVGGMSRGGISGVDHGTMSGMNHGGMPGMDHGNMQTMDDTGATMMDSGDMRMMDHGQHAESGGAANSLGMSDEAARHAHTEYGPSTGMHVDMAHTNLDDFGVGSCSNECRVLVFADIYTIDDLMDKRSPECKMELHFTSSMRRYTRSFNGVGLGKSTPVHFCYGEQLRIILRNDTVAAYPAHLHGM